jgi:hypothetical protein
MSDTIRLLTRKDDLGATVVDTLPSTPLAEGEIRLKVDSFALTTNNISYAAYGDAIGYWQVFPTARDGLGAMPVWGFAEVVESRTDSVAPGVRVWGYLPIAESFVVCPDNVTRYGFVDAAPNRSAVPAVYSRYIRCDADPQYRQELESAQSIYRPLFITSYTTVDFLASKRFFGARRIVISSASSKTAYGIAWCLRNEAISLIGLTGARNRSFVEALGCYETVTDYSSVENIPADEPVLYIDLANDIDLRARIHRHFGERLVYDCMVGSTQGDAFPADTQLLGPKPRFFFAAERLDQHREEGTIRTFLKRFEQDQLAFIEHTIRSSPPWIEMVEEQGFRAAARIIRDLADGRSDPARGHIVRVGTEYSQSG